MFKIKLSLFLHSHFRSCHLLFCFKGFPLQAPLVYHYGHTSPANEKLYNKISSKIAEITKQRFEKNKKGKS